LDEFTCDGRFTHWSSNARQFDNIPLLIQKNAPFGRQAPIAFRRAVIPVDRRTICSALRHFCASLRAATAKTRLFSRSTFVAGLIAVR
jgi:hypothetical protein